MTQTRIGIEFAERVLDTGLTAIAVQNPGVPTTAVSVSLRIGQLDEADGEHGLAYLTGSCLEEGTERLDAIRHAEAIESIGGSLTTTSAGARIACPATEIDAACELLRETVLEPGFREADVERVKREIVAEIVSDDEEPATVAQQRFTTEVYGAHPFGRPVYGSRESTEAQTVDDLHRFHQKWYRPAEGYVAIAGPDEPERSLDRLESTFARFRGAPIASATFEPPELPEASRRVHVSMPREQVHVYLGHVGVRRSNPDYHKLLVMDHVLGAGAGFTARIPQRLRDEQGLCYSVGSSITSSAGLEPGTFRAYIGTSPEHRETAVEGFLREIRLIREEAPTIEEVQVAQDYLAGSFVLGLERNVSLVGFAIRAKRYGLGFDYLQEFPRLVRAVRANDVREVAAKHLHPDRVVVVSAGAD